MPDTTSGAADPQAGTAAQPQEGGSQAQVANAQQSQADSADNESGTEDVAQLRDALAAANREAAKHRNELKKIRDAEKVAEEQKLPEADRQARRLQELETDNATLAQQLRAERTRSRVTAAAQRLGFIDPSDAYPMLDPNDIEFDEAGEPKHVDRLLGDVLRSKPHLARQARSNGSGEGGVRGTAQPQNNWFSEAFAKRRGG